MCILEEDADLLILLGELWKELSKHTVIDTDLVEKGESSAKLIFSHQSRLSSSAIIRDNREER